MNRSLVQTPGEQDIIEILTIIVITILRNFPLLRYKVVNVKPRRGVFNSLFG